MTTVELVKMIANESGQTQVATKNFLTTLSSVVMSNITNGDKICIGDLGSVRMVIKPPRAGVNPKTGEHIQIGERRKIQFKASKDLKESLDS